MAARRKDKEYNHDTQAINKRNRQEKIENFSDSDLSDTDDGDEIFNGIRIPVKRSPITSTENLGPCMIIKNIIANNFKSFYGEVTIGPFDKSLTSIFGANDSGISDVIDSLLFVFGYQSTKMLSKEVSLFLHKSINHKDVSQCSVTVNFVLIHDEDSQEKEFVGIPGSEISITHTAFKDNTSFYTLNNKRVKFEDIATILKKNGIDLIHNRFLIIQGDLIDTMMKPKAENEHSTGMLEYLEDFIRTVRYKKPITKLEAKLEVISLKKFEKMIDMKLIAKDREGLEELAMTAVNFLKLENKRIWVDIEQTQFFLHEKNKIIESKTEELNKIKDKLSSIRYELNAIYENKKENKKILDDLSIMLPSNIIKSTEYRKKYYGFIETDKKMQNEIKTLELKLKIYENSTHLEKKKISKSKEVLKFKEAELYQLKSKLESLENNCGKLRFDSYEKLKIIKKEKYESDLLSSIFRRLVDCKQYKFKTFKTEFEVLLFIEKYEHEKLRKLEDQMISTTDKHQENIGKKQKAESDIQNSRDTIKDMDSNIEKLKDEEKHMQTNLQNLRQILNEKKTAYAKKTEHSRSIQYILELKDSGEIQGLLGRCGDYGRVEEKYDIPACTACESVDEIVVETIDAARACIQKLKTNNIGRLTFSILPQVQKLKPYADANNNPENSKRVFDFVQILDQRFRLTFYSGLYDTLVAENLEQARRIAFDNQIRYRVVTYTGDLIDHSGIMSGGGRAIKSQIGPQETTSRYSSGNKSQVSRNEVDSLDKIVQDLEVKLRQNQCNICDFQANIEKHHGIIEDLNFIVRQCSLSIDFWKVKEYQVKSLIEAQKLVIIKKKTDVANKEEEIKEAEKELEVSQVEYNKIMSEVNMFKKKMEEINKEDPELVKHLFDEKSYKLEKTQRKIIQAEADLEAVNRKIKISHGQIKKCNTVLNESRKKMNSIKKEIVKNCKLLKEQSLKLDELGRIIGRQKKIKINIRNKEDENIAKNIELRINEIQLKQDLESVEQIVVKNKEECWIYKHKLSTLKLFEIPNIDIKLRDPVQKACKKSSPHCKNFNKSTLKQINEEENSEQSKISPEKEKASLDQDDPHLMKTDMDIIEELKEKPHYYLSILEEYQKRTQQYNEIVDEYDAVYLLYNDHINMINKVQQQRRDEFMASFKKITIQFKEVYQMITLGGDAELELSDPLDPFSEGVTLSIKPPNETWKSISNLSGSDKTLAILALIFSLHRYIPLPFYVIDEIDAVLDIKNVSLIYYYIKECTKNAQFISISSCLNMIEKANQIVGMIKTNDYIQAISLRTNTCGN